MRISDKTNNYWQYIYRPPKDTLENYYEFITELAPILNTLESNKVKP